MPVSEGRKGKISVQICAATSKGWYTVGEMGTWSIAGVTRDMVEHSAFQDSVKKFKPGMLDGGSISFNGYWDGTDARQTGLVTLLSSGTPIINTTVAAKLGLLRLWANDDTTLSGPGFWSCTGSSGKVYITQIELGQDKSGLGTINFTGKVTDGILAWSTLST